MHSSSRFFTALFVVCVLSFVFSNSASAQKPADCTASQTTAIECFVYNAVATNITQPRYGMSLAQFETYGVAVNKILQTHHTYLVLVGLSGAIADALPPTNSNGSANLGAQDVAVTQIVDAAVSSKLISVPRRYFAPGCSVVFPRRHRSHERQQRLHVAPHSRRQSPHDRFLRRHRHIQRNRQLDRSQFQPLRRRGQLRLLRPDQNSPPA